MISLLPIAAFKFCWLKLNIISEGSAVLSLALKKENTWESTEATNDLAVAPFTPSVPSLPPLSPNIVVISLTDSFDTSTVIGNFVLSPLNVLLNVILPDIWPVPVAEEETNVGLVIVVPPESFIVISDGNGELDKFWWLIISNISSSNATFDDADANENIWESDVTDIIIALAPDPSTPALDLANVNTFDIETSLAPEPDLAVNVTDPESCDIPVIWILLLELVAVTPSVFEPVNVKLEVTLVNPLKTSIAVVPAAKLDTTPDELAGNVWDSFVKKAVIDDSPCLDFARDITLVIDTLADLAVKLTDPESTVIPVIVNELLELVAVIPFELDPVNV